MGKGQGKLCVILNKVGEGSRDIERERGTRDIERERYLERERGTRDMGRERDRGSVETYRERVFYRAMPPSDRRWSKVDYKLNIKLIPYCLHEVKERMRQDLLTCCNVRLSVPAEDLLHCSVP